MSFTGGGHELSCRIALQSYLWGTPLFLTYVNGRRMDRNGSEKVGLLRGLGEALGLGNDDALARYVEERRWALGVMVSLRGSHPVQFGESWGGRVADDRVQALIAQTIASSFESQYRRVQERPGFSGVRLENLTKQISEYVQR
jgi:hypothetical protein